MASPLTNDAFFSQLDAGLRQTVLGLTTVPAAIRFLSEFLVENWLSCPLSIASSSSRARFFGDELTAWLTKKGLPQGQVTMAGCLLAKLFDICSHASAPPTPSLISPSSSSSAGASSPASSPAAAKRASASDVASAAKKAKEEKPRTFDVSKLMHINPNATQFWDYALAFAKLLDPVHPQRLTCPGCHKERASNLPYNFWKHCFAKCQARSADVFFETASAGAAVAPMIAPPPQIAIEFGNLSSDALSKLPLSWRAFFDLQHSPSAARDVPAASLVASPSPPRTNQPPPPAVLPSEEPLPQPLFRTTDSSGSFGSLGSLLNLDFPLDPITTNHR